MSCRLPVYDLQISTRASASCAAQSARSRGSAAPSHACCPCAHFKVRLSSITHLQGDPSAAPWAVDNAKEILGKKPMFGICMGHQILGQAFGASTFKLSFGHHGGNHPIRDMTTGKVQISAQNHNFAVDAKQLPEAVQVSHLNLNDGAPLTLPRIERIQTKRVRSLLPKQYCEVPMTDTLVSSIAGGECLRSVHNHCLVAR